MNMPRIKICCIIVLFMLIFLLSCNTNKNNLSIHQTHRSETIKISEELKQILPGSLKPASKEPHQENITV